MTKYQVVARTPEGLEMPVGEPEPFLTLAEIHAAQLRACLLQVDRADKVILRVDFVEAT